MLETSKVLGEFGVSHELVVVSAHRSPARTDRLVESYQRSGAKVLIAAAGGAAHLAGTVAARSVLPVIGVPLDSSPLKGLDALLSTVQMPGGVPVATVSIGKWGARNAGVLAVQILAVHDGSLRDKLKAYKAKMSRDVEDADRKIRSRQ